MTGGWQGWESWFFSALAGHGDSYPTSVSYVANAYAALGIPRNKIGIGIGLYGANYRPWPAWKPGFSYSAGEESLVLHGPARLSLHEERVSSNAEGPTASGEDVADGTVALAATSGRWAQAEPAHEPRRAKVTTTNGATTSSRRGTWVMASGAGIPRPMNRNLLFPGGFTPPDSAYGHTYSTGGYLTYEDEESIAAKGRSCATNGFGGAIIWTLNYGCTDPGRGSNPPLEAARRAFF